jgi:hypothetical protein
MVEDFKNSLLKLDHSPEKRPDPHQGAVERTENHI